MTSSSTPMSFRSAAAKAGLFVLVLAALPAVGCGGDNGGGSPDSGMQMQATDAATVFHRDAAGTTPSEAGGEASLTSMYDGTVGMPCASDADCQPAGGPGVAICSLSLTPTVYPTPVCMLLTCNPGTDNLIHYCDGPDDPSSPGICIQVSSTQSLCLPQCVFAADGSTALGCNGHDACSFYGAGVGTNNEVIGVGYCWGACTADADCPSGSSCQTNQGECVTTPTTPTKALGQACTDADNTSGACLCDVDLSSTAANPPGLCTQFCQVGLTSDACPSGYVCQAFEPNTLTGSTAGTSTPGFTTQNTGLLGLCEAACTAGDGGGGSGEADASSDEGGVTTSDASSASGADTGGGGACPTPATCDTSTAAGATCIP
ncbi:MAG TPA: hypothetical protein VK841_00070 [Polyangiaceae bacterium]|jgi:hypothetical protein|nr:hypothetical protein [Polyangiaceae bacterium]